MTCSLAWFEPATGSYGVVVAVALALLLAPGCGRSYGHELHTGLDSEPGADSEDSAQDAEDYSEVKGLPVCKWGWVRLPPSSDKTDRDHDFYTFQEVHALVYGDAEWTGAPAALYPVVYRTFAQDEYPVGWEVYGTVRGEGYFWEVTYAMFNGWDENTQPFTLACASPAP